MKIKGWGILFFKVFYEQYKQLVNHVESLRKNDPEGYKSRPGTKLLASVQKAIKEDVPENPFDKKFMLSQMLEKKYKEWRRVKKGLPPRYRMFFRFHSKHKNIIFAWINDETTLRSKGYKHDVYVIFQKMLENGTIPSEYSELMKYSRRHHHL